LESVHGCQQMVKRVLIAFDFDHTLIDETVDTYVLKLLPDGAQLPASIEKMNSVHHWNDYQREVFRYLHSMHVTKDQLLACVDEMPMVKGMRELLEYLASFRMVNAKNTGHGVEKTGVARAHVAENGHFAMHRQQRSMVNGSATLPLGSAGFHSMVDGIGKSSALDPPVQFDVIIVSDANLVSTFHCSSFHYIYVLVTHIVSFQ